MMNLKKGEQWLTVGKDCYNTIVSLYEAIAAKLRYPVTDKTRFDCKDISVARNIQDNIFNYYESQGADKCEVGMLWVCYGPKCDETLEDDMCVFGEHFINEEG